MLGSGIVAGFKLRSKGEGKRSIRRPFVFQVRCAPAVLRFTLLKIIDRFCCWLLRCLLLRVLRTTCDQNEGYHS